MQKNADAEIVNTRIVRGKSQILDAAVLDRLQQQFRNTAEAKAPGGNQHVVVQKTVQRLGRRTIDLVHSITLLDKPFATVWGAERAKVNDQARLQASIRITT